MKFITNFYNPESIFLGLNRIYPNRNFTSSFNVIVLCEDPIFHSFTTWKKKKNFRKIIKKLCKYEKSKEKLGV